MCAKSLQSCPTLCDPLDCSLPGSSVQGILQARILEGVAIPFSGQLPKISSKANYILKALFLNIIILGARALTHGFWEDTI